MERSRSIVLVGLLAAGASSAPAAQTCVFRLIDASPAGSPGNGTSYTVKLSGDGRFVAIESSSTNLVSGDANGLRDVFVHDLWTGTTELASVTSSGAQANGVSIVLAISGDGRFVVFSSWATNLDPADQDGKGDIYLHDRATGLTEWISVPLTPVPSVFDCGLFSGVSDDGRFVTFASNDTNLVASDTNGWADVFVRDRISQTTSLVSKSSAGVQADRGSAEPDMSADGSRVSFLSFATNLHPSGGSWPIPTTHLYTHDLAAGVTQAIDLDSFGRLPELGVVGEYDMSPDGASIVFWGSYTLHPDQVMGNILWREGVPGFETIDFPNGQAGIGQEAPELSWDGRFVAFGTGYPLWKVNPFETYKDLILHDTSIGVSSLVTTFEPSKPILHGGFWPEVSYDGGAVAFLTNSPLITGFPLADHQLAAVRLCDTTPGLTFCFPTRSPTGCVPSLVGVGTPSATLAVAHTLTVSSVRNDQIGLFLYGTGGDTVQPIWNGWLCVAAPFTRMPVQATGGNALPAADCSGTLSVDFNDWVVGGADPALVSGTPVCVQSWSRDPSHPGGALLSDAAAFVIGL